MKWPKHTIYWTICSALTLGLSIGLVLSLERFEPRESEIVTVYEKAKLIIFFIIYGGMFYVAGTEYHELKRKMKSD